MVLFGCFRRILLGEEENEGGTWFWFSGLVFWDKKGGGREGSE